MPKILGDITPVHELKEPEFVVNKTGVRGGVRRKIVCGVSSVGVRIPRGDGLTPLIIEMEIRDGQVHLRAPHGLLVIKPRYANSVEVAVET